MPWYSDKKEWVNTRLIFNLKELDSITDLKFTHEGLTPDLECYKDCEPGWTHWIKTAFFLILRPGKVNSDHLPGDHLFQFPKYKLHHEES